jgi:hypothetical protein
MKTLHDEAEGSMNSKRQFWELQQSSMLRKIPAELKIDREKLIFLLIELCASGYCLLSPHQSSGCFRKNNFSLHTGAGIVVGCQQKSFSRFSIAADWNEKLLPASSPRSLSRSLLRLQLSGWRQWWRIATLTSGNGGNHESRAASEKSQTKAASEM